MTPLYYCILALFALPTILMLVLLFVVAPINVHGSQRLAIKPGREPIDPASLSSEMREFIEAVAGRLREVGFEEGSLERLVKSGVPGVETANVLLVNRAAGETAIIIGTKSATIRTLVYTIRTDFDDESRVSTVFSASIGVFPRNPSDVAETFPFVDDPLLIVEAHRRQLKKHGRQNLALRPLPTKEGIDEFQEWEWERNMRYSVSRGYYWIDREGGFYRMTWKGAFLMTWKLVTPIKQWRIALRNRRARRIWMELGMPAPAINTALDAPVAASLVEEEVDDGRTLPYESQLSEGEVRVEMRVGQAIVRAGGPTIYGVLWKQIFHLGLLAFLGFFFAMSLYQRWQIRLLVRRLPAAVAIPLAQPIPFSTWLLGGILAWDAYRLVLALRVARGTSVVIASSSGLRLTTRKKKARFFPRARIESLSVYHRAMDGRTTGFDLGVTLFGQTGHICLITGYDEPAVAAARDALARAMGIEPDAPNTPPLTAAAAG
jgi:hypothetical protein